VFCVSWQNSSPTHGFIAHSTPRRIFFKELNKLRSVKLSSTFCISCSSCLTCNLNISIAASDRIGCNVCPLRSHVGWRFHIRTWIYIFNLREMWVALCNGQVSWIKNVRSLIQFFPFFFFFCIWPEPLIRIRNYLFLYLKACFLIWNIG
jgi:hypothetical protein